MGGTEFIFGSTYVLIMFGGVLLAGAGGVASWLQKRRARLALMSDTEGGQCIACSSAETVELHPDAWRCPSCGYEQGAGWQRRRDERRLEKLMQLSPEEASKRAQAALLDARLMLTGAVATFDRPIIASRNPNHRNNDWEVNPDLLTAVGDARTAHKGLQEAGMLDTDVAKALEKAGFSFSEPFPDTDPLFDGTWRSTIESCARKTKVDVESWRVAAVSAARSLGLDA